MKRPFLYFAFLLLPVFLSAQKVLSITVDGSINPASAAFIKSAIDQATAENDQCLIIQLNTPGGLLTSTRVIVSAILKSQVPVVVYVAPAGAHAGSAGVFVTMAAHIAAMAPSTNIGAAHPVGGQGAMNSVMSSKTTNDAAAFIKTIAEKRNRNFQWAEEAVRHSVAITENEALKNKVIDLIAPSENMLLLQIDGRTVDVNGTTKTLHTANATVEKLGMSFTEKFLNIISDPNIAYILMMLGFYGLLFELYSPGAILPGIVGVICLVLAFYSMHALPVNYAGISLIIFALLLFVLEIKIVSHGMLTIGGIVSLILGSMMLIRTHSALELVGLSKTTIFLTTAITSLFFIFLIAMVLKAQRTKPVTGIEGLIGETGQIVMDIAPVGMVKVHGELWKAKTTSGDIATGKKVRVTAIQDLTLFVEEV